MLGRIDEVLLSLGLVAMLCDAVAGSCWEAEFYVPLGTTRVDELIDAAGVLDGEVGVPVTAWRRENGVVFLCHVGR